MPTRIPQLIRALSQPLCIEPTTLFRLASVFQRKLKGHSFTAEQLHAELGIPMSEDRQKPSMESRIAVIPVYGVIAQHPHSLGTSTDEIGAMFDAAMKNPDVGAVLFDVDSPGGTVSGVPELAQHIAESKGRDGRPVWAIANSLAASAAYWIASAADKVFVTPSGEAGSIGVYMLHEDWSKHLEEAGIKITAITAGKFKTEGAPWEPLGEDAQARFQADVNDIYAWFVRDVARFRRDTQTAVREGYGQGRVLLAKDAVAARLVDEVATFDETLARMVAARPRRSKRTDARRRTLEILRH